jgi:hypothetical protein
MQKYSKAKFKERQGLRDLQREPDKRARLVEAARGQRQPHWKYHVSDLKAMGIGSARLYGVNSIPRTS